MINMISGFIDFSLLLYVLVTWLNWSI